MHRVILALWVLFGLAWQAAAQQPTAAERERARELAEVKRKLALLDSTSAQFKTYEKARQMRRQVLDARPKPKLASREELARRGDELVSRYRWRQMQRQAAMNAWGMAAAVNAQAQQPTPWAPQPAPYYPPYAGPFYETISHAGRQTYISGFGPYGAFGETISQSGDQVYISGYGLPPYAGAGPGF